MKAIIAAIFLLVAGVATAASARSYITRHTLAMAALDAGCSDLTPQTKRVYADDTQEVFLVTCGFNSVTVVVCKKLDGQCRSLMTQDQAMSPTW